MKKNGKPQQRAISSFFAKAAAQKASSTARADSSVSVNALSQPIAKTTEKVKVVPPISQTQTTPTYSSPPRGESLDVSLDEADKAVYTISPAPAPASLAEKRQASPAAAVERRKKPRSDTSPSLDPAGASTSGPVSDIAPSDPERHARFQAKLARRDVKRAGRDVDDESRAAAPALDFTPLEKQVKELKAQYPGILLVIEVGYKYRFFGPDAEVASQVLHIFCYQDRNFLTASFPTHRLAINSRRLVEAGHKVGVVRQIETAAMKAHSSNKSGPFVRKLTALYTKATIDAAEDTAKEGGGAAEGRVTSKVDERSKYLVCIVEGRAAEGPGGSGTAPIGLVAVEPSSGEVLHAELRDSTMRAEVERHLLCLQASELLVCGATAPTQKLLEFMFGGGSTRIDQADPAKYRDGGAEAALASFFASTSSEGASDAAEAEVGEAEAMEAMARGAASMEAVRALGPLVLQGLAHCLDYLRPFGLEEVLRLTSHFRPMALAHEMALPSNTLRQLEVLCNAEDGSVKGSLLWLLDHTGTAFGARLLQRWVARPLRSLEHIQQRQDAVQELLALSAALGPRASARALSEAQAHEGPGAVLLGLPAVLGRLPDLERALMRVFHGTASPAEFVAAMEGLRAAAAHLQPLLQGGEGGGEALSSALLRRLAGEAGAAPVAALAGQLLGVLDCGAAREGDRLKVFRDKERFPDVAQSEAAVQARVQDLQELLPELRAALKLPRLQYFEVSGIDHLIEVPTDMKVPAGWICVNSTKKAKRYHPPQVREGLEALALAREEHAATCARAWLRFLQAFRNHFAACRAAVRALAALDCLLSLAVVAGNEGYCRPRLEDGLAPRIVIEEGRHPVLDVALSGAYVANSVELGGGKQLAAVITGPNMGGKSSFIRQVGLIAIMAQVGSYVPAASCSQHVLDAVLTRMGASDNLMRGSSTFMEEMLETADILAGATERSLVIVDELGRGTSTHDGVAIAHATLQTLLTANRCLTLFVTHYPPIAHLRNTLPDLLSAYYVSFLQPAPLAQAAEGSEGAAAGRGEGSGGGEAGRVEAQGPSAVEAEAAQSVTFLYKLREGVAKRSFGLNVARMASVPEAIIQRAAVKAAELEHATVERSKKRLSQSAHSEPGAQPPDESTSGTLARDDSMQGADHGEGRYAVLRMIFEAAGPSGTTSDVARARELLVKCQTNLGEGGVQMNRSEQDVALEQMETD